MRGNVAAKRKRRVEVDLDDVVEVRVWKDFGRVSPLDAGAIDEDADLEAVGEDAWDERGDFCGGGEVGDVEVRFAAEGFDGGFGGLVGGVALVTNVSFGVSLIWQKSSKKRGHE